MKKANFTNHAHLKIERMIIHFSSKDGGPVLIEILDAKEFVLSSIASVIQEKKVALSL